MRTNDLFRELEAEAPLAPDEAAEIDAPYRLAANVYRLRKARGMSQAAVADALGVTQPRVAQIERGDANLRIGTVARLAVALGCDIRDLLAPLHERVMSESRNFVYDPHEVQGFVVQRVGTQSGTRCAPSKLADGVVVENPFTGFLRRDAARMFAGNDNFALAG